MKRRTAAAAGQRKKLRGEDTAPPLDAAKPSPMSRIRTLESEIQASSSKVNNLVEILERMRSKDRRVAKAAMHALRRLFTTCEAVNHVTRKNPHGAGLPIEKTGDTAQAARGVFIKWVASKYAEYKKELMSNLGDQDGDMAQISLVILMQLFKLESQCAQAGFAADCFASVVRALFQVTASDTDGLVSIFARNFASEYDDARFYTLKTIKTLLTGLRLASSNGTKAESHADMAHRAAVLLLSINIPDSSRSTLDHFWCAPANANATAMGAEAGTVVDEGKCCSTARVAQPRSHRKLFGDCWMELLQVRGLEVETHRLVLLRMHDRILPSIPHPLLLSDFLTDAYGHGGVVSMLAMHGLFILMSKHGLEYPHFFQRLYALLKPSIFHVAHRDQFFKLTDLFLTSKGLSIYIVAAFIKRLAQLALTAPPSGCLLLLPCIYNLLQRHPACKCMIHRDRKRVLDGGVCGGNRDGNSRSIDPFVPEEDDPAKAHALESSLWELESLNRYYYPSVSKFVKVFTTDYTKPVCSRCCWVL